jgi:hypothetical protein
MLLWAFGLAMSIVVPKRTKKKRKRKRKKTPPPIYMRRLPYKVEKEANMSGP